MASNASDKDVTTSDKVIKYVADHSIRCVVLVIPDLRVSTSDALL